MTLLYYQHPSVNNTGQLATASILNRNFRKHNPTHSYTHRPRGDRLLPNSK